MTRSDNVTRQLKRSIPAIGTFAAVTALIISLAQFSWEIDDRLDAIEDNLPTLGKRLDALEKGPEAYSILTLPDTSDPCADVGSESDPIGIGQITEGQLDSADVQLADGSYYDAWALCITELHTVAITMESDDLDSYLFLAQGLPSSPEWRSLDADDDGGGGLNARITTILAPGQYSVVANTFDEGDTGQYTLSVVSVR